MDAGREQATGLEKHTEMIRRAYSLEEKADTRKIQRTTLCCVLYKRASVPPSENEAISAGYGRPEKRRNARMGEQDKAGPRRVGKCNES